MGFEQNKLIIHHIFPGREYQPFSTSGQRAAAIGMDRVSKEIGAEFMLTLGKHVIN